MKVPIEYSPYRAHGAHESIGVPRMQNNDYSLFSIVYLLFGFRTTEYSCKTQY